MLGLNAVGRYVSRYRLLVLCYHGVCEGSDRPWTMPTPEAFARQMERVRRFFTPISLPQLLEWADRGARLPPRAALVTFDDGYRNNLLHAAPILERFGVPAVFGIATGYIGASRRLWPDEVRAGVLRWGQSDIPMPPGLSSPASPPTSRTELSEAIVRHCKRLAPGARDAYIARLRTCEGEGIKNLVDEGEPFLSWDEVRELRRRGFHIASHTVDHPILTTLSAGELVAELRTSKARIEHELGEECPSLIYPNGGADDVSPAVAAEARRAGYRLGFTLTGELNPPKCDALLLSRVPVFGGSSLARFEVAISVPGVVKAVA
jgi:peptidoglycan/xylan/chitin deacetylase (PgdA/CDA1 family)